MGVDAGLGRANVAIRATMDKLAGDLGQARGQVDSAVKKMASGAVDGLQTIGKIALGGIGAGVGLVAGAIAGLGKIAINAAPVQGIADAFDGVAASAGISGDTMLASLQKGSSGMIPARDLMLSFNKAASLVSTDFATQLPDAMKYLSKVSASTGQDMGFLMDSLVTGVGRVSPMILDNLGIQVGLADATARASEMFGVEAGALDKTQIQAGMMNVVLEKLAANTAAMPDVTQSAAAKLAQLSAGFQDTKDKIGMAFLPALTAVLTIVSDLAARVLPPLTDFLTGTLAPAFERVAQVVGDFVWMLGVGIEPLDALKIAIAQLFGPEVAETVMGIVASIGEFLTKAEEVLAPIIAWVSENVKLQDVLIALGVAIATVVIPAVWGILAAAAPVIGVFVAVIAIVALLRAAWETNFLGIRDIAANVWGWLQTFIPQALTTIQAIFNTVVTAIQTFWAEHGETIKATAQTMWDAVVAVFDWFKGFFTTLFQTWSLAFQGDWRGFGEKIRETWDEAWVKIKEIGTKAWDAIQKFFKETDWGSVGRNILEGIAKGITAGLEVIKTAAKNAARAALDAAKGFLGIQSPSKLAAIRIGEPFAAGIGAGIGKATPDMIKAAQRASMMLAQATERDLVTGTRALRSTTSDEPRGLGQVIIYNLTLEGVQNKAGLLAELQALT